MARLGRLAAVVIVSSTVLVGGATVASADHCKPIDNPPPLEGQNTTYCHTPKPTPGQETPEPTATPKPTSTPALAPVSTPRRTFAPSTGSTTGTAPTSTPFDIEVPEEDPLATPVIVVDGPLDDPEELAIAEEAGSLSNWIFGFILGFIIGGLVGRASWGLRRRRRQQIFG